MGYGDMVMYSAFFGFAGGLVSHYDWMINLLVKRHITKEDDKKYPERVRLVVFFMRLVRGVFIGTATCFAYNYFVSFKGTFEVQLMGVSGLSFFASFSTSLVMKRVSIFGQG